ncbi:MAG TPA: ATP-binding protein [Candidatus Sulfotelmatobacter sp.]|nr:ATP-binding protein [Candidatus Sulfotelmatobacter sp.]
MSLLSVTVIIKGLSFQQEIDGLSKVLPDLLILIICSIAITTLGLLIVVRNPSQAINRNFAYMSLALVSWSIANYLSDHVNTNVLFYTRLTILTGIVAIYCVLNFVNNFPTPTHFKRRFFLLFHTSLTIVLIPLSLTPEVIQSVTISGSSSTVTTSFIYWLFVFYVAYSLALLLVIIFKKRKETHLVSQKRQVSIVSWGIILYAVLAVISNVLLPLVINNWSSSRLGPAFTLILSGMVAYAIVRHRLFDIRLIIARSIAYLLALATLAGAFTLIASSITNYAFKNLNDSQARIIYTALAIVLALFYPAIKHYFDVFTRKIFYRDAYDTQAFLDELNKTIIDNIELGILLRRSAMVIEDYIKCERAAFIIRDEGTDTIRVTGSKDLKADDFKSLYKILDKQDESMIVYDNLEEGETDLKKTLRNNRVAIAIRLQSKEHSATAHKNYMIFGYKKSGNIYNNTDIKVIEILANELVIAIQNALRFEEIQAFNVTLQQKVNEATYKLRKANERLKVLDETKDDFISMASHQLRTPLTSIKGYLSMILEGDAGKVTHTQKDMIGQAFFSSQKMVYLIADMLNVSRLKTGKFSIENTKVNLAQLVEQEMQQLEDTAMSHNVHLTYNRPKEFPDLMMDETKIRQVVMNFVDNAIYYTPKNGHINVNLKNKDTSIELTVTDDGIGVPNSEKHHLFNKFYRAGNARKVRPDGTGLGLYMAKKVVVAQGGSLIFESQEGKGSTFGFNFSKEKLAVKPGDKKAAPAKELHAAHS